MCQKISLDGTKNVPNLKLMQLFFNFYSELFGNLVRSRKMILKCVRQYKKKVRTTGVQEFNRIETHFLLGSVWSRLVLAT